MSSVFEEQLGMETIEIFGIGEEELLGLLNYLPNLWEKTRDRFESKIKLLFDKVVEKENLLFAVHAFSSSSGGGIIILLTEYLRDIETASFSIHSYRFADIDTPEWVPAGRRLRDILESRINEDFEVFSKLRGDEIFVCPKCSAKYFLRTLKITRDGRVECQNCGRIVEYNESNQKQ